MDDPPAAPRRLRKRHFALATTGIVVASAGVVWLYRAPILTGFIDRELQRAGVPAQYELVSDGFGVQRLRNLVMGDPDHPDLTARDVTVTLGYTWTGVDVAAIAASGVRLRGTWTPDRGLSLGALDRFRGDDATPFTLPPYRVRLADARVDLTAPQGTVSAQLSGEGQLDRRWAGTLRLSAPQIADKDCTVVRPAFDGRLSLDASAPRVTGTVAAASAGCPEMEQQGVAGWIDARGTADFARWTGQYRLTGQALRLDAARLDRWTASGNARVDSAGVTALLRAEGSGISGSIDARRASFAGRVVAGRTPLRMAGQVHAERIAVPPGVDQTLAAFPDQLRGTPLAPLAVSLTSAGRRALADLDLTTGIAWRGGPRPRVVLMAPTLRAASGAGLVASNDARAAVLLGGRDPAVLIGGVWNLGGGGLPSGKLRLRRDAGGKVDGLLTLLPYTSGRARLALDPVALSAARDGTVRFETHVALDGPLGDGDVRGLRFPLHGRITPTGAFQINPACSDVAVESLRTGSVRIGATRLQVCPLPGMPLVSRAARGALVARGVVSESLIPLGFGTTPARLAFDGGVLDLASGWSLRNPALLIGNGESTTAMNAALLTGTMPVAGQLTGTVAQGTARIGTVPLLLSAIDGNWISDVGDLKLTGSARVDDAAPVDRFMPMVSRDAIITMAGGTIRATASLAESVGERPVMRVAIEHALNAGQGHADLMVDGLTFTEDFQPEAITPLTLGVIANVEGRVTGTGRIDWSRDGVTSRGAFETENANLAAAFGPVRGVNARIEFDDLLNFRTDRVQTMRLSELNPGIAIVDGDVRYRILSATRMEVLGGRWPFAGGELVLRPTVLDFGAGTQRQMVFDVVGVDAARFLQNFEFENLSATGVFDGTLPIVFDADGGRIVDGELRARAGGGTIAYVGELARRDLGVMANMAFGALKALQYRDLTIRLNGDLAGEIVTDVRFAGISQGAGTTQNFLTRRIAKLPFVFNIRISGPFRQLISSVRSYYDPSLLIEQNLPALLQAERDAANRDANKPSDPDVQPAESEKRP